MLGKVIFIYLGLFLCSMKLCLPASVEVSAPETRVLLLIGIILVRKIAPVRLTVLFVEINNDLVYLKSGQCRENQISALG
jgi:hypothetical protein